MGEEKASERLDEILIEKKDSISLAKIYKDQMLRDLV